MVTYAWGKPYWLQGELETRDPRRLAYRWRLRAILALDRCLLAQHGGFALVQATEPGLPANSLMENEKLPLLKW